ncbi:hypothetical protein LXL04_000942 [Taraxacum kok-saghyz]
MKSSLREVNGRLYATEVLIEKTAKRLRKQTKQRRSQLASGSSSSPLPPNTITRENPIFSSETEPETQPNSSAESTPPSSPNHNTPPTSPKIQKMGEAKQTLREWAQQYYNNDPYVELHDNNQWWTDNSVQNQLYYPPPETSSPNMSLEDIVRSLEADTQAYQNQPYYPPTETYSSAMPSLEDIVKSLATSSQSYQQETKVDIQNLEQQISQITTSVNEMISQEELTAQSESNPGHEACEITSEIWKSYESPKVLVYEEESDEEIVVDEHEEENKVYEPTPPEVEVVVEDYISLDNKDAEMEVEIKEAEIELEKPTYVTESEAPKVGEGSVELNTTLHLTTLRNINVGPTNDPPVIGNLLVINTFDENVYERTRRHVKKYSWKMKYDATHVRKSKMKEGMPYDPVRNGVELTTLNKCAFREAPRRTLWSDKLLQASRTMLKFKLGEGCLTNHFLISLYGSQMQELKGSRVIT